MVATTASALKPGEGKKGKANSPFKLSTRKLHPLPAFHMAWVRTWHRAIPQGKGVWEMQSSTAGRVPAENSAAMKGEEGYQETESLPQVMGGIYGKTSCKI